MRETWRALAIVASTAALCCALAIVPVALVILLTRQAPAELRETDMGTVYGVTEVTRYVVTADGQQIGTHYATRAEAEREAARCRRAREEVGPYDDTP